MQGRPCRNFDLQATDPTSCFLLGGGAASVPHNKDGAAASVPPYEDGSECVCSLTDCSVGHIPTHTADTAHLRPRHRATVSEFEP